MLLNLISVRRAQPWNGSCQDTAGCPAGGAVRPAGPPHLPWACGYLHARKAGAGYLLYMDAAHVLSGTGATTLHAVLRRPTQHC